MAKWNVHFSTELTYDVEIEANSYEEAVKKAEQEKVELSDMDCFDKDVTAWRLWEGIK